MNALKEGWFTELELNLFPGHCFSLEIDKILYEGKSKYQKILVFSKYKFKNKKLKICY